MIIRQAPLEDAAGIAKVQVDTWRTAYRGIIPETFLFNMSYEEYEKHWIGHLSDADGRTCTFVAEDELGHIVGFVSGGPERNNDPVYKSQLYTIYIVQTHQGQGIGRYLTVALVERLLQMGMDSLLLWVFASNPACRFYEALGGQKVKTNQFELDGVTIEEVAYGWTDIRTLLKEAQT